MAPPPPETPLRYDTPGLTYDSGNHYDSGAGPGPGPGPDPYEPKLKKHHKTMNKFKLELKKRTVISKLSLGETHITAMTGNAAYPDATRVPTDVQVQTAQDELAAANAAVDEAEVIWKQSIQARDLKETAWDTVITARANNCEAVTPDDLAALASTGFPLRTNPSPIGVLPMPANLVAKASDYEGQIDLSCAPVSGASSYEWLCRVHTDGTPWEAIKPSTSAKISATDLTPGTEYAFRVRAVGSAGPSPWSGEAVKRAA